MKKYYIYFWGLGIGFLLALLNTLAFGIPGFALGAYVLAQGLSNCSGESCWGKGIFIGNILFIVLSLLVAFIIQHFRTRTVPTPLWVKNVIFWCVCFIVLVLVGCLMFTIF